jgi:hypothetical protein
MECKVHDISDYMRELLALPPHQMARKMLTIVGEINVKLRAELLQGRYDWFRPIHSTYV